MNHEAFFREIQDVYDEIGEGKPAGGSPPGRTAGCGGIGEPCCTWPAVATRLRQPHLG